MKFSEAVQKIYPGCVPTKDFRIVSDTAPRVNLAKLKDILLSTDQELLKENSWIFEGDSKYLDGTDPATQRVAFCTMSRSGNSFFRKYLENITGVTTGCALVSTLTAALFMKGLKGEQTTDNSVWIAKSHYPMFLPTINRPLVTNQIICVVRNPIDVIVSNFYLVHSFTHDKIIE